MSDGKKAAFLYGKGYTYHTAAAKIHHKYIEALNDWNEWSLPHGPIKYCFGQSFETFCYEVTTISGELVADQIFP